MKPEPPPPHCSPRVLDAFIENSPGLAWILDRSGAFLKANRGFQVLLGIDSTDLIGSDSASVFGAELGDLCKKNREAIEKTGDKQEFTQTLLLKDGSHRTFQINEFPIPSDNGVTCFGGIAIDITTQTQSELELLENRYRLTRLNRLYLVINQINNIIVRASDRETLLNDVCRIVIAKTNIHLAWVGHHDSITGKVIPLAASGSSKDYIQLLDITPADSLKSTGPVARALRTGIYDVSNNISYDETFSHKSEAKKYGFNSCGAFPFTFDNGERGILVIYSNNSHFFQSEEVLLFQSLAENMTYAIYSISSKKRIQSTQEQLTDSQRQMSTLMENLPGMVYRCRLDESWTMEFVSQGVFELTGYHPHELLKNREISFDSVIHPSDRDWVRKDVQMAVSRNTRFQLTYRILNRNKGERWVWERGQGIPEADGTVKYLEGFISDVSDQHLAYTHMQEQARLIDQAHDAIIICNDAGEIAFWNQGASRLYGYPREEVMGMKIKDILKTGDEHLGDAIREVKRAGEWKGELIRICADGSEKTVQSRWTRISDSDTADSAVLTIESDITERRNLEKQFLRAQRMESVGSLAGGIAHDLNNILSPILMSTELLEDSLPGDEERKILKRIKSSAGRAASLLQQLLSFSRGLEYSSKPINMTEFSGEMKTLVFEAISDAVEIDFQVEDGLPQIRANPTQINQVLLNLALNARDAMDNQGLLKVHLYKKTKTRVPPDIIPGNFVVIEVSDTGSGIPPERLEQIFEPFFSTKLESGGTGLGLSTSLSIVKNHGGFIDVDSTPGVGTSFKIFLPALGMILDAKETTYHHHISPESITIMVVDDEASMRSALSQTLEKLQYRVETAAHGQEALDCIKKHPSSINVVLTDINMPILDGVALAGTLKKNYPQILSIAMSGFEHEGGLNEKHDSRELFRAFLPKPFTTSELINTINRCLNSNDTST